MTALVDALKAKYGTPANALRALGMPISLIGGRHAMDEGLSTDEIKGLRKLLAKDEASESQSPSARLFAILKGKLSPEELKAVGELLEQLSAPDEEEPDETEEPDDKKEDEFEEEEPEQEERARSKDAALGARRGVMGVKRIGAMDAAPNEALFSRIPNLRRIGVASDVVALAHDGRPQNVKLSSPVKRTAADDERFAKMFPNLRRVA